MRVGVWVVVLLAVSAPVFAQTPPSENGLGPFSFGMTIDAARAVAPNTDWRVEDAQGSQIMMGGPPAVIGGNRLSIALVFQRNELERIVLTAAAAGGCVDAVMAVVEDLEPAYGSFHSAPALSEPLPTEIRRTDLGSELRVVAAGDDRTGDVNSTQRRADMLVHIAGEQDEARCRLRISFDNRVRAVRAEVRDLFERVDRAETTLVQWEARPEAPVFARYYPRNAASRGLDGYAILDCIILETGRAECLVADDGPLGEGFGNAAAAVARDFRADVSGENASKIGQRVRLRIRFQTAR